MNNKKLTVLLSIALVLAIGVVTLGAYTRLTHAGLGCPDWPGCYGHLVLPEQGEARQQAQQSFPQIPIESRKAWTEMAHRYAAGSLGLFIFLITAFAIRAQQRLALPLILVALVFFQAALGMWTVTLKLLPVVVMGHLLGGLTIIACLMWLRMQSSSSLQPRWQATPLARLALAALVIVYCQIALGGWVSANYAGIACVGFPMCNGQWLPHLQFQEAFNVLSPIGANYQGGLLEVTARVTIQYVHRIGAMVATLAVLTLAWQCFRQAHTALQQKLGVMLAALVLTQFSLGIANVVWLLPLPVAVLHNGVAALLLATVVATNFAIALPTQRLGATA